MRTRAVSSVLSAAARISTVIGEHTPRPSMNAPRLLSKRACRVPPYSRREDSKACVLEEFGWWAGQRRTCQCIDGRHLSGTHHHHPSCTPRQESSTMSSAVRLQFQVERVSPATPQSCENACLG